MAATYHERAGGGGKENCDLVKKSIDYRPAPEYHDVTMRTRIVIVLASAALLCSAMAPPTAVAACCELRKIDADPPSARVRVCDPATTPSCAEWLYDGTLATGDSTPVCAASDRVSYQEWDTTAAAWGPTTEARCEDGGDVEI